MATEEIKTESLPKTLAECKAKRHLRININEEHDKSLKLLERLAVWVTDRVGTMGFFLLILSERQLVLDQVHGGQALT